MLYIFELFSCVLIVTIIKQNMYMDDFLGFKKMELMFLNHFKMAVHVFCSVIALLIDFWDKYMPEMLNIL